MIRKFIFIGVAAAFLMGVPPVKAQVIGEDDSVDMRKPSADDTPSGSASKIPGEAVQSVLYKSDGNPVGFAVFRRAPKGVIVSVNVSKIPSGWHGVHIHTNPDCTLRQFTAFDQSGGHLGSEGLAHGFMVGAGPQNGDLPNIWIDSGGTGRAEFYSTGLDFEDLVGGKGRSILIDEKADDHITPPSGNSGAHLVCGIVRRDAERQ